MEAEQSQQDQDEQELPSASVVAESWGMQFESDAEREEFEREVMERYLQAMQNIPFSDERPSDGAEKND